jgi:hypothetical protein
MPNRRLAETELALAATLLDEIRAKLDELAGEDAELLWALRRKIYKELAYDERGKPTHRRVLKLKKWKSQHGKCTLCNADLPEAGTVLDRIEAMKGYTIENTRLLCPTCDTRIQKERGYA